MCVFFYIAPSQRNANLMWFSWALNAAVWARGMSQHFSAAYLVLQGRKQEYCEWGPGGGGVKGRAKLPFVVWIVLLCLPTNTEVCNIKPTLGWETHKSNGCSYRVFRKYCSFEGKEKFTNALFNIKVNELHFGNTLHAFRCNAFCTYHQSICVNFLFSPGLFYRETYETLCKGSGNFKT